MTLPHTRENVQRMAESFPHKGSPRIDIHCHVIPEEFWKASDEGDSGLAWQCISILGGPLCGNDSAMR
jgi:hypothetical protein